MKVLLISNQHPNSHGIGNPIMYRMRNALAKDGRIEQVDFEPVYYTFKAMLALRYKAKKYDVIHVHFGGLYALIIWFFLFRIKTVKIITFHGTDIHAKALKTTKSWKKKLKIRINQKASFLSIFLFDKCGFVAREMLDYVPTWLAAEIKRKAFLQSLGVDYSLFVPMSKKEAQKHLGLKYGNYVLFSDVSNTNIKRRDIAEAVVEKLGRPYQLLIMSSVKPTEVPYFINSCDFALLTSDEEGSPNIIREVLALNKPFFSVAVGDAEKQLKNLNNSAIISRNPIDAAKTIRQKMNLIYTDNTRENKRGILDFVNVNRSVVDLYLKVTQ